MHMSAFYVKTRASTRPLKPDQTVQLGLYTFKSAFACLKLKISIVDVRIFSYSDDDDLITAPLFKYKLFFKGGVILAMSIKASVPFFLSKRKEMRFLIFFAIGAISANSIFDQVLLIYWVNFTLW